MSDQYIGEIRMVGFNFAPQGWALCNGQLLSIDENAELFTLLGTTYGGDGQSNFALPNLQSSVPIHQGGAYIPGQVGGQETITLTIPQLPAHNHSVYASTTIGTQAGPGNNLPASVSGVAAEKVYTASPPSQAMSTSMIAITGSGHTVSVIEPYLCINFIIALEGFFPSQG